MTCSAKAIVSATHARPKPDKPGEFLLHGASNYYAARMSVL